MELYLAVDGGGSKTNLALFDAAGRKVAVTAQETSSVSDLRVSAAADVLRRGIETLLAQAGTTPANIAQSAFCLAGIGEDDEIDQQARATLGAQWGSVVVVNDAVAALYAGHAGKPGITVASGTGSIACGLDESGVLVRCGGYAHLFSDEGSSYWLGVHILSLFCKQDDGRLSRSALHTLLTQHTGAADAYALMRWSDGRSRKEIAALQPLLEQAADAGDASAVETYAEAGRELALLAQGVRVQGHFVSTPVPVTSAGGTFKAGQWLTQPFETALAGQGLQHVNARFDDPMYGAALLAFDSAGGDIEAFAERIAQNM